ncbi:MULTISPECIES: arsenate reductase ArsC [Methanobacterium]|uniref:ArsC family transcriptional regulator n=1 Tax=Methanobacterium bryantii TaxID=2161 RepID=A0A2A2HAE4_METBR|nr:MULTISPECIES: arsenate reductase ArsC [Methanobacterium]OEC88487.1 ArsC family transcriptional regulator [Methanobacterium sp. A39]PAV06358.1 ArsC family transcriptional regulator [Methanobacterium bryantii]
MAKERVLFMCIHNAARSQMAEGLFRHLHGDDFDVYSAGSDPQKVDPLAIKCMGEIGIDISGHRSKSLNEFEGQEFDYIITVCGNPYNACPFFAGGRKYFKHPAQNSRILAPQTLVFEGFEDPSAFDGTDGEKLELFKKIRDELKEWLEDLYYSYMIPERCNLSEERGECCGPNKEFSCK